MNVITHEAALANLMALDNEFDKLTKAGGTPGIGVADKIFLLVKEDGTLKFEERSTLNKWKWSFKNFIQNVKSTFGGKKHLQLRVEDHQDKIATLFQQAYSGTLETEQKNTLNMIKNKVMGMVAAIQVNCIQKSSDLAPEFQENIKTLPRIEVLNKRSKELGNLLTKLAKIGVEPAVANERSTEASSDLFPIDEPYLEPPSCGSSGPVYSLTRPMTTLLTSTCSLLRPTKTKVAIGVGVVYLGVQSVVWMIDMLFKLASLIGDMKDLLKVMKPENLKQIQEIARRAEQIQNSMEQQLRLTNQLGGSLQQQLQSNEAMRLAFTDTSLRLQQLGEEMHDQTLRIVDAANAQRITDASVAQIRDTTLRTAQITQEFNQQLGIIQRSVDSLPSVVHGEVVAGVEQLSALQASGSVVNTLATVAGHLAYQSGGGFLATFAGAGQLLLH